MDTVKNDAADKFTISGNWNDQSKHLKSKYSQLTDSDLKFETGKENDLVGRIASRLNKKNEEVISILKETTPKKA